jgi:Pol polyprotein, beta-barrel domain/Integrase core domain/GAG-pre-integrase domain
MEGRAPWNNQNESKIIPNKSSPAVPPVQNQPSTLFTSNSTKSARFADEKKPNIVMMAHITEMDDESKVVVSANTSVFSSMEEGSHFWFINSAASSHICGNKSLFESMHEVPTITIEMASGESFTADKRGMIKITLRSIDMDDVTVTLQEVVYVPSLDINLLSVGRVTGANVDVSFSKDYAYLSLDNTIISQGLKINNLFAFRAIVDEPACDDTKHAYSSIKPSEATLWHHRLAHVSYSTINKMSKSNTVIGLPPKIDIEQTSQCTNCPYRKQICAPFKQVEDIRENIGDVIASDLCGPFDLSVGGYRYFVTWIDLKTRYISIEFLKNKECKTVTESFKRYLAWLLRQKGANVKHVRTDNGREYAGHEFQHLCSELGIAHETTSLYTPEHNGIAERYNRTLQEGALTLIHDSGLS